MAGNVRFESTSASPEELGFTGSYPNGQRGNFSSATLDRSGSFRNSSDSRIFGSGSSNPRASAVAAGDIMPLTQYLVLDPITMGDQKYTRSGELRRALGISIGSSTEDNSFGPCHSKPLPPAAIEELKRFKASVLDATVKARGRMKRLNDSLLKLNKYCEALNLKKQQRNEMLSSERSGSTFLKMGMQIHRNASDLSTQKLEDRTKNIVLNKRVRSSMAELRADGQRNNFARQPLVIGKDRDMLKDGGEASDLAEEKVRPLPAGGEGWDKKMKRKRSVGTVFTRPIDNDGEGKRVMHQKFNGEPSVQSYDAQGFRSGSFNATGGVHKLDGNSSPACSNDLPISKNDPEKISLTRDFAAGVNKERLVVKANNKLNILEDDHTVSPSLVTKGKASRTPRSGSVMAANLASNFSRMSGALDGWDQPSSINKVNSVGGPNSRKRPLPTGSSSPPMAQWVGQRPQKMSRTRRANVVSPVSNHDEVSMSPEGGQPSDFAARVTSVVVNGPLLGKDVANGIQQARVKHENVSSPARISESEESGAGENREGRPKDMGIGSCAIEEKSLNQNVGSTLLLAKKNKILNKEDTGDGVRRQGRTGRGLTSSRAPMREKLEHSTISKPLRSAKPVLDKNGSKSGRPPLKKISERKGFTRLGQTFVGSSPDFTGESDDDREELLAAANFACNASYLLCTSSFWKKMEQVFGPVCSENTSYLKQQLKSAEELHGSLLQIFNHADNNLGEVAHGEDFSFFEECKGSLHVQDQPQKLARTADLADEGWDKGTSCVSLDRRNKVAPLYQRVLSALIVEDESEEYEGNTGGRTNHFGYTGDSSPGDNCLPIDFQPKNGDVIVVDYDSMLGYKTQKQSYGDALPCNGSTTCDKIEFENQFLKDGLLQGGQGLAYTKNGMFPGHSDSTDGELVLKIKTSGISILDCQYDQMCLEDKLLMELQSVGLFLETVPDLADGEDEEINQEIVELQKGLDQQVGKKKVFLSKLIKAIEERRETEGRALEQVAMDRLVDLAYKKQLATRGSTASKLGIPKVSKQVAQAFMNRTLARCRKFECTGKSCFSEPGFKEVIFSAPSLGNDAECMSCIGLADTTNIHGRAPISQQGLSPSGLLPNGAEQHDLSTDKFGRVASDASGNLAHLCDQDFARTGPIWNRGKKKEVLLDDVGGNASFKAASSLGNSLLGGAKGKRSERERDKDILARNSGTKAGRASNAKGDRKAKSKPKQKTALLSSSGDGNITRVTEATSNKKREIGAVSLGYSPRDYSKEGRETTSVANLQDFDSIGLTGANDFGSDHDLSNLLNLDDVCLPENEDIFGLEIPMDDLSTIM